MLRSGLMSAAVVHWGVVPASKRRVAAAGRAAWSAGAATAAAALAMCEGCASWAVVCQLVHAGLMPCGPSKRCLKPRGGVTAVAVSVQVQLVAVMRQRGNQGQPDECHIQQSRDHVQ
jgi:hypothetical protein